MKLRAVRQRAGYGKNGCERCNVNCLFKAGQDFPQPAEIAGPTAAIEALRYDPGEVICRQQETRESIVAIQSGLVKQVEFLDDGTQRIVLLAGAGDAIGLEALLGQPLRHDVVALRPTGACLVPIALLKRLGERKPQLFFNLMSLWQRNLDFATRSVAQFSCGPIAIRVARLILFRAGIERNRERDEITLLNRQDMAAILGVSHENVCRVIAAFRRSKLLKKIKRDVYLCDLQGLQVLATAGHCCQCH